MILVKAKMNRTQVLDKSFEGKETRNYLFYCQKTDLDGSLIPVVITTKQLEVSKLLESHLSDGDFHLIPISNARVNAYSMNGQATYTLDDSLVSHPDFTNLDTSLMM